MTYYSQIGQDEWVATKSNFKKGGTFLDVGGGHPTLINNTYYLEKNLGWTGLSIDIGKGCEGHVFDTASDEEYQKLWKHERKTQLIIADALKIDFDSTLDSYFSENKIDYMSIDLDPPEVTLEALLKVLEGKFTFNFVTFETDHYRCRTTRRPSRAHMQRHGYTLSKTVSCRYGEQEDWYVRK